MSAGPHGPGPDDWGQPGGAQPAPPPSWGGEASPPQTNGKATGALVASILGFFCGIGFVVGLVLGYSARNEIRASGGRQAGEGMATAAIVIGWIGVALSVLGVVVALLFLPIAFVSG